MKDDIQCPTCGSTNTVKFGKTAVGAQRFLCKNSNCKTNTFQANYTYIGCEKMMYKTKFPRMKIYNVQPLEA